MGLCPEISSAAVGQLEGHLVISLELEMRWPKLAKWSSRETNTHWELLRHWSDASTKGYLDNSYLFQSRSHFYLYIFIYIVKSMSIHVLDFCHKQIARKKGQPHLCRFVWPWSWSKPLEFWSRYIHTPVEQPVQDQLGEIAALNLGWDSSNLL